MKRFHVHTYVADLQASIAFYSKMFGAQPARIESDYAKWMLDDPRINFAISARGGKTGIDHLGIQADSAEELVELRERATAADMTLLDVGQTTCCYAKSDKYWVTDPQGIAWEQFHTLADIPVFSEEAPQASEKASACCAGDSPRGKPISIPVKAAGEMSAKPAAKPACC